MDSGRINFSLIKTNSTIFIGGSRSLTSFQLIINGLIIKYE